MNHEVPVAALLIQLFVSRTPTSGTNFSDNQDL